MKATRFEINSKEEVVLCSHWKSFPPITPGVNTLEELESAWGKSEISVPDYQRAKIYFQICGLRKMDSEVCMGCPHMRLVKQRMGLPVMVSLDGKLTTPLVDPLNFETSLRYPSRQIK